MNEWLAQLDINSIIIGLFAGLLIGLLGAVSMCWLLEIQIPENLTPAP